MPGLFLRQRDQVGDRAHRQRRVHAYDQGAGGDEADRGEILARVVADIAVERRIDGQRAGAAEPQRVAVGHALGDLAGGDAAACAATIFDHDLLAQRLAHFLGGGPRHEVVAAAGRVGNDQGDGPARIILRAGRGREQDGDDGRHERESRLSCTDLSVVIPGRREAASPESITTSWDYGFRVPSLRSGPGMTSERKEVPQHAHQQRDIVFHGQPHSTHSGFRPIDLIRTDHLLSSRSIRAACSSGVVAIGSAPSW